MPLLSSYELRRRSQFANRDASFRTPIGISDEKNIPRIESLRVDGELMQYYNLFKYNQIEALESSDQTSPVYLVYNNDLNKGRGKESGFSLGSNQVEPSKQDDEEIQRISDDGTIPISPVRNLHIHLENSTMNTVVEGKYISETYQPASGFEKGLLIRDNILENNRRSIEIAYSLQRAKPAVSRVTKGKYSLSDFNISRTLGTGSFGRVHLVQSRHNNRFYSIKVLKKKQIVQMKQVEHTNDERTMLAKVRHPFLVALWGTFYDCQNLYMVMDFVEGGELFSLLRKSQRFPNSVAKFYASEVILALDYLHSNDIIYRDLKPENLLLDRRGHIKIIDFGFAKYVPDRTWTLCGTPDYLAPEIISSKGYSKSVDWWSLGILIYEMLAGFPPFYADNPLKLYENILEGDVKYPPLFDNYIQDLLKHLLTADLTRRYGNLADGSLDIMRHPWFAEVDWERLLRREIEAPYIPSLKIGGGDASLFDVYPEEDDEFGKQGDDLYGQLFKDF